jgi:predicted nucleic acid-binding Zn ribbon protein
LDFEQLYQASTFQLSDLKPSTWQALCEPPLAVLPRDVALARRARIDAIPFREVFGMVAVLSLLRESATLDSLVMLGVIEAKDGEKGIEQLAEDSPQFAQAGDNQHTLKDGGLDIIQTSVNGRGGTSTQRHCTRCGVAFNSQRYRRFCSTECRFEERKSRPLNPQPPATRQCQQCGADYLSNDPRARYCSRTCYAKSSNTKRQQKRAAERTAKTCIMCGTIFTPRHSQAQILCSAKCGKARHYQRQGYQLPGQRRPLDCVTCGTSFVPQTGRQITCSESCGQERKRHNEREAKKRLRQRQGERIAALVEQFSPPERWRWLVRHLHELGAERMAEAAGLSPAELSKVLGSCRARQLD